MTTTRRSFLLRTVSAGGAVATAGALEGCAPTINPAPFADVDPPVNGKLSIEVARYPDLAKDGGAITARAPGLYPPVLVVHPSGTEYAAMSSICTHAGCPLGYEGEVVCPCHGSRFGLDGAVHNPPARQGLKTYPAKYDGTSGDVVIDLNAGDAGFPAYANGKVVFPLAQFPQLATPGGSVVGTPAGLGHAIIVIALAGGTYSALTAVCTHMACIVGYYPSAGDIECRCHGSTFDTQGNVTHGPAQTALAAYGATTDGTAVTVTIP